MLSSGWGPSDWADILPRLSLPHLRGIHLVGIDTVNLAVFLGRHPSVRSVLLDGLQIGDSEPANGTLVLPNLNTIEGDEVEIANFLELLEPLPSLRLATVVFREDCSMETPSALLDTFACLTAFSLLAIIQGEAYLSLFFDFSSTRNLSTPSLFLSHESRPE